LRRREFIGTVVGTAVAAVAMPKTTIKDPYGDFLERIRPKMIEAKRSGVDFDQISIDPAVGLSGIRYRKVHLHVSGRPDVQSFENMALLALLTVPWLRSRETIRAPILVFALPKERMAPPLERSPICDFNFQQFSPPD